MRIPVKALLEGRKQAIIYGWRMGTADRPASIRRGRIEIKRENPLGYSSSTKSNTHILRDNGRGYLLGRRPSLTIWYFAEVVLNGVDKNCRWTIRAAFMRLRPLHGPPQCIFADLDGDMPGAWTCCPSVCLKAHSRVPSAIICVKASK
jgi:hypothetical protein